MDVPLKHGMICRFRNGCKGVLVSAGDRFKIRHITDTGQVMGSMVFTEEELWPDIAHVYKKRDNHKQIQVLNRWKRKGKK